MENQAGGFKGFLGSLFAVVISYIAPIYDYVIIIAYIFLINFIIGLIEDIIVKHKTFKCKKFYFCLCEMLVFYLLVGSVYFIGNKFHNKAMALQCISAIVSIVTYFYSLNILTNIKSLLPNNRAISFIHYIVSFEIVKKIPYFKEFETHEASESNRRKGA